MAEIKSQTENATEETFTQSEVNRIIGERLLHERKKLEREFEEKRASIIRETEAATRQEFEESGRAILLEREAEVSSREAEVLLRELRSDAAESLARLGLPGSLLEVLDYSSSERLKSSLESVEKAFGSAISSAVNEKLTGGMPRAGVSPEGGLTSKFREAVGVE